MTPAVKTASINPVKPIDRNTTPVQIAECKCYPRRPQGIKWVTEFTGKTKQTIYRWEREGRFPKRIKIGPNSVAWLESDVRAWLDDCAA